MGVALLSGAVFLSGLIACSDMSLPVLRSRASAPTEPIVPPGSADPRAAQCDDLRAQIRTNRQALREAPTLSTSPEIVAAAQAKADQHIDELRARMDELDCGADETAPSEAAGKSRPLAPLPPAPGSSVPASDLP